jgi:hypothetical protein
MVAVIAPRIALLQAALGSDADPVHFVDMAQLGRNPACFIPAWRSFVEERATSGQPVRGTGEPIWSRRRLQEVSECQLHEALINLAVERATPLWLPCPYDVDALDDDVVTEARRSHPVLAADGGSTGNTIYEGTHHIGGIFETNLPEPPTPSARRAFTSADLARVRDDVIEHARQANIATDRVSDLALAVAVSEVTANSVLHGCGTGDLSIWREPDALFIEVRDHGPRP